MFPRGQKKKKRTHARKNTTTHKRQQERSREQAKLASVKEWVQKHTTQRCSKTLIEERKEKKSLLEENRKLD